MSDLQSNPPATSELSEEHLQGFKFFKRFHGLFDTLHSSAAHRNRQLHFDEYAISLLFYFFNPAITSLRGIQRASDFKKVQKVLGIRRMSLGSMSESVRLFDPELLKNVFEQLAGNAKEQPHDRKLSNLGQRLTAVDGTILPALPRMAWAVWLGDHGRAAKAHVQFEVLNNTPAHVDITPGVSSESQKLKERLESGRLYIMDRGYRDFDLFHKIVEADSSFVVRLGDNAIAETLEDIELTPEAKAAGVLSDQIVRLGCEASRKKFARPVRFVKIHVEEKAPRGLKYPVKKVSSKKNVRRPVGKAYTMLIATDRLDLPADVIGLIFQHRWKVELFFRLLKSVLGCRHLLSDSIDGVTIQVYCALIASLLLAEHTGLKPSKRTFELVTLYLQGWADDQEFARELGKLKKQAAAKKS